jgi:TusA-related sulfurtransferase
MDATDLLNQIRLAIGEKPVEATDIEVEQKREEKAPKWIKKEPKAEFDGNAMLDRDENPLAEITKKMHQLEKGDIVTLSVDFRPEPLIDEFLKRGYKVYTEENDKGFLTYIKKK